MKKRTIRRKSAKPSYLKWGLAILVIYLCASLVTASGPFSFFAAPASINVANVSSTRSRTTTTPTNRAGRTPVTTTNPGGATTNSGNNSTNTPSNNPPPNNTNNTRDREQPVRNAASGRTGDGPAEDPSLLSQAVGLVVTTTTGIVNPLIALGGAGLNVVGNVINNGLNPDNANNDRGRTSQPQSGIPQTNTKDGDSSPVLDPNNCKACVEAQKQDGSIRCDDICNTAYPVHPPTYPVQPPTGDLPITNSNNGQPPQTCPGGYAPMRIGLSYPTGGPYKGDKNRRACVEIMANCVHGPVKPCDEISAALVVLPYNAGCEYTDGTDTSAGACEQRGNRCIDSDGAPVPSGSTREGKDGKESCDNGRWKLADPKNTGVTFEQCMAGIPPTEKCVPIQGTGDYGRVPVTAPSVITSVPPVQPANTTSKSVCYGEKIADIVIQSAIGAGGAMLGPVFSGAAGVEVITAIVGGVPAVISCADKDNPSYAFCRDGKFPDAKSGGCKDLPTSTNEEGQPVVQVTKTLCNSLPVVPISIQAACAGIKVGEQVSVLLDQDDGNVNPPNTVPQSNANQPPQSQSSTSILSDAPGLVNVDTVGTIAGCVGGVVATFLPCSAPLIGGILGLPASIVCRVAACTGFSMVGNKSGDIIYNITH